GAAGVCVCVCMCVCVCVYQKNITAKSGQNVTLTCRAPNNNIGVIEWKKADLKEDEYVLLYRDGHFDPDEQHPSFKNRVDLQDRQMKDGDVSLILKYVTINDTGTYECRVQKDGDSLKSISNITLSVVDPPGDSLKRKWILFCSSLITYLTADTSHLFLTCRSARRTHRGWREEGWICWTDSRSVSWGYCCCWWWSCDLQTI
uniref:Ig-like domain-containing protein n=1 Tax=Oreochromis aureus TaxID=47969 RepID=A0AAZ1XQI2_OREAU